MLEKEFPILKRKINGHKLVYLDNASTTQKPRVVIEAISNFYKFHNANIHRGIHTLSQEATQMYEEVRDKVQKFLNAKSRDEIIFTSGATEAINLVVWTWGHENIHRGDEILLTEMEHHSNLVPWQVLAKKKGARLKVMPLNLPPLNLPLIMGEKKKRKQVSPPPKGKGEGRRGWSLDLRNLDKLITKRTKIVALTHVSNVLGTVNPVEKIVKAAHKKGAIVLIDGAQAGGHLKIDVRKLDCDFYVLSGHKMYGPTGVGVLYGRRELLEKMPPYQTGGHMIKQVTFKDTTWNDLPWKFEAGTAPIAEVIGLGAAVDFLSGFPSPLAGEGSRVRGIKAIERHEFHLTTYALKKLKQIPDLAIYGPKDAKNRIGVISFNLKDVPPHDLASILDEQGIAIRTGHHCAMPLHEKLGLESTARISFAIYNTKEDFDKLIDGLNYARSVLSLRGVRLGRTTKQSQ